MRRVLGHKQLGAQHQVVHLTDGDRTEFVELYANNNCASRSEVDVVFGGQLFALRVRDVTSSAEYGDILCNESGELAVFISSFGCDTYGHADLVVRDGRAASDELRPGDVVGVGEQYAVVVRSVPDVKLEPPIPDGSHADWRKWTRRDQSNYKEGGGTLSTVEGRLVECSAQHMLAAGDLVVADVGGQHALGRVEAVVDGQRFTLRSAMSCGAATWWRVMPDTTELTVAPLLAFDALRSGAALRVKGVNFFGGLALSQRGADGGFATCAHDPIRCDVAVERRMRITLRPRSQRVRILPGAPVGCGTCVTCACTTGEPASDVSVFGHSYVPAATPVRTVMR